MKLTEPTGPALSGKGIAALASLALIMMVLSLAMGRARISPETTAQFMKSFRLLMAVSPCSAPQGVFASPARGRIKEVSSIGHERA
jgi:hypothetical protein